MKFLIFGVIAVIVVLAVVAGRRGRRHGGVNPAENYYGGSAMIHSARQAGGADGISSMSP
ncbi:hypothetical protein Cme02nite_61470 [Catellatospora methionotrophica]|uniref:Uncharacterized protein n=1 Tax=Catellatospora methionotrophica TaxID=121620 RepID=A0A8J3LNH7_9ACTN|nr:hypothetical protein [Catellatospora methionotrophica]GIG17815.1 hypothetical protein Cme02nite_61470 [Catellatospora methionotrophica]